VDVGDGHGDVFVDYHCDDDDITTLLSNTLFRTRAWVWLCNMEHVLSNNGAEEVVKHDWKSSYTNQFKFAEVQPGHR
jgi:hypothetical protein